MKRKRGSTHDKMFEAAHFGKKSSKKKPSQAARRTGSVRASMEGKGKQPKSRSKTKTKVSIGRDTKTGKFVSLSESSRRGVVVENYSRKPRGKGKNK